MKNISFLSENFQVLEVKFSVYLNMRVFVRTDRYIPRDYRTGDKKLLLQYWTDGFETSYMFKSLSENLHMMLIFCFNIFGVFDFFLFRRNFSYLVCEACFLILTLCVTTPRIFH